MKISYILCFSFICVFLEARPDDSTSLIDSKSVENESPTTNENANYSDNIEKDGQNTETTVLPTLQPELRSDNDDYGSDNASDSVIVERKDESSARYGSDEQIIETTEINNANRELVEQDDRDGKSEENKEDRPNKDNNSYESSSEERSYESSEEDTSELDNTAPLENTRRMNSYPTAKPAVVVTQPGDNAGQNLESRGAYGLKPRIPLRSVHIPTVRPNAPLLNSRSFTTPVPYPKPIKLQTYPNAATYLNRLPFGSYNRKSMSGLPIFPKSDLSRPGTPLIDDFAPEPYSNSYPYISSTPAPLDIFPQDIFPKNIYNKLMQASEHPVPYQPRLYPFRSTGYRNPNYFLGQKDFKLRPHTIKRNL